MLSLGLILLVAALILFGLASFNVSSPVNLVAAGLFFLTLAAVLTGTGVLT